MTQVDYELVDVVNRQINQGKVEIHIPRALMNAATEDGRDAVSELVRLNKCTIKIV
jgi:hypothetical protein